MRRVLILGCAGSGKSLLARRLGQRLELPVVHLDAEFWNPGWVETEPEPWRDRVAELAAQDAWIMDGNFSGTLDLRVPRADTILFLDFPRWLCLGRILKRVATHYGRTRPDLAPDCPERFDFPFLVWVWNFRRNSRPKVIDAIERLGGHATVHRFTSPRDVAAYLAGVDSGAQSLG